MEISMPTIIAIPAYFMVTILPPFLHDSFNVDRVFSNLNTVRLTPSSLASDDICFVYWPH